jgi:hypothetical protein
MLKTKFKVGDIVSFKDDHAHNPANKVTTIGKIELINIFDGKEFFIRTGRGEKEAKNLKGKVTYSIAGYSLMLEEKYLTLERRKKC